MIIYIYYNIINIIIITGIGAFPCTFAPHCSSSYTYRWNLKRHIRSAHTCELCHEKFADLENHSNECSRKVEENEEKSEVLQSKRSRRSVSRTVTKKQSGSEKKRDEVCTDIINMLSNLFLRYMASKNCVFPVPMISIIMMYFSQPRTIQTMAKMLRNRERRKAAVQ